ncbi:S-adenosylmethionine-dependent methyltransferase [Saccharomyces paradoxus]|uniref:Ribosomal lysine N-methyltransferase 5 n=1 Tax=Saccharomyces paradoxus TaxID=27291 RepID=A0A8B8UW23_SACPA|nr:Rkm5 [Saccharomyces paradoxus]QHS74874.1 Rkm5 [Saccharomyces paradoxus]
MSFKLWLLDEETIYEHVFERYMQLEGQSGKLPQDLGIQDRSGCVLEIAIEPSGLESGKKKKRVRRRNKADAFEEDREVAVDSYHVSVEQSISSLHSSRDNGNSTTGYVLWSTTPFFINWLLYNASAAPFRLGTQVEVVRGSPCEGHMLELPKLIDLTGADHSKRCILELGAGIAGILPVVLGNFVDIYVSTDQKGILNKLKDNIMENLSQLTRKQCISESLRLELPTLEPVDNGATATKSALPKSTLNLEVAALDWEKINLQDKKTHSLHPELSLIGETCSSVYVIAMDVIYNEYLIDPFLKTLEQLKHWFRITYSLQFHALVGIHLRSQEVTTLFLEKAIIEHDFTVYDIIDQVLQESRFNFYLIS